MINLVFWIWASLCLNPNHISGNQNGGNQTHVTTNSVDDGDTHGETGGTPKPPTPPPPPPTGN